MLVLFFGLYHYQLTMSCSDYHIVNLKSDMQSMPETWDRYSKTKLKFLFKISDQIYIYLS